METKTILVWIILAVVILAAGWLVWWYASTHNIPGTDIIENTAKNKNTTQKPTQKAAPVDSSDKAIDTTLSTMDSQLKNLDSDSTSIDASINGM